MALLLLTVSCSGGDSGSGNNENGSTETKTQADCFRLLKDTGMNAIRLRVWVDPQSPDGYGSAYCDKADTVTKAKRAQALGMDVMIDFHYSDRFTDPGAQIKPNAWKEKTLEELTQAIQAHTTDVLQALKASGITPKWVQVGNEIRSGILWDSDESISGATWGENSNPNTCKYINTSGKTVTFNAAKNFSNFITFLNAAHDAVKSVFSEAKVIVHMDSAYKIEWLDWIYGELKTQNARYDMIGLSHYPQDNSEKSWKEMNSLAIKNIQSLHKDYGKPVMICEVGVKSNSSEAASALSEFIDGIKDLDGCQGIFYWEPQVYGGWKPDIYSTWGWNAYSMGAFTQDGTPGSCLASFSILPDSFAKGADISWITEMEADGIMFYESE